MSTIELYMIRHGLAEERGTYANDDERPLTEAGIRKTRRVAKRLDELDIRCDLILTSPLTRAWQTAEIMQTYQLGAAFEAAQSLAPGGDLNIWLSWLQQWRQTGGNSLMIIGHEPDLGEWATALIGGAAHHNLIVKKAGVIGLLLPSSESPIGRSQLFWLSPPRFLLG